MTVIAIISASAIAHIPGPAPTPHAIQSAEEDTQIQVNATHGFHYVYEYYTDDPGWDLHPACVDGLLTPLVDGLHSLFPFHEYSTSTLVFDLVPDANYSPPSPHQIVGPLIVAVEVNPSTGQIYHISSFSCCA